MPSTFSSKLKRKRGVLVKHQYGGRATAGGVGYEVQVAAFLAIKMLGGDRCAALPGLSGADIATITMQAPESVDDVILSLSGRPEASVFISAKQRANTIPLTPKSPAFADTVAAFVRQFFKLSPDARRRSRFLWAVPSSAGKSANHDLHLALDSHREDGGRTLDRFLLGRSVRERKAMKAFINQVMRVWKKETGKTPPDNEIRDLLRMVYIAVYDFELGIQCDQLAQGDIRAQIVAKPKEAERVWEETKQLFNRADQRGLCITRSILRSALTAAGIKLKSSPDYAEDISLLEGLTKRNLSRLKDHTVLRFGVQETDKVHIERTEELSALEAAAKAGHTLIAGEPGCGKSGLIDPLSAALQRLGYPVVLLLAEEVFGRDWKASATLPGLTHALDEVLANWPTGARGFLITDALDAVRDPETQKALYRLLQDVKDGQSGWTVIASVREFDLKYGHELRKAFPGHGVAGHSSSEFAGVSHFHLTGLAESQLDELATLRPEISGFIASARKNAKSGGIHRSPFFLRLAAELLCDGVKPTRLADWNSPAVLLRKFWDARISTDPGASEREVALRAICGKMTETRTMALSIKELSLTAGTRDAVVDLRRRGILQAPILKHGAPVGEEQIRFSHHLLHDYAIARSLIPAISTRFVEFAIREPLLPVFYRQSFLFALEELWDGPEGPAGFWACTLKLEGIAELHGVTRILAPTLASRRVDTLSDLQPLLDVVRTEIDPDSSAQKAVRHLASGLEDVDADMVRSSMTAWFRFVDQLATSISAIPALENPSVLVLAKLNSVYRDGDRKDLLALNSAGRNVLAYHVSKTVSKSWTYAGLVSIETVCKTFDFAPSESADALISILSPSRIAEFPHHDFYALASRINGLGATGEKVVLQLFRAAFGTEPKPGDWEPFGGAIMPMRMQTSDHWKSVHHALANYYERRDGANAAVMTELACIAWNAVFSRRNGTESHDVVATIQFRGVQCQITADFQSFRARNLDPEEDRIISRFEDLLREWAAKRDTERLTTALDRLVRLNLSSLIWSIFLQVGSEHPDTLGGLLEELLAEPVFLVHPDYSYGGTSLFGALHALGGRERRERLERLALDLPKSARPLFSKARGQEKELTAHVQDRLLGTLEESNIVLPATRKLRRTRSATHPLPENPKPEGFRVSFSPVTPEEIAERHGANLKDTANAELLRLQRALTPFLERDANKFDVRQVERDWKIIEECERALQRYGRSHPQMSQSLWGHLVGACENITSHAEWSARSKRWNTIRKILLKAAKDPDPKPSKSDREVTNDGLAWGWPAPRIDAARGLPLLVHRLGESDRATAGALRKLCRDKSLPLRRNLAQRLFMLEKSAHALMWDIFDEFIKHEEMLSVVDAVLWSLNDLWPRNPIQVRKRLQVIIKRVMRKAPTKHHIYEMLAQMNLFRFLRTGDSECEAFITKLIGECDSPRAKGALERQLHNCRDGGWLTVGDGEKSEKFADAVRARTWDFFSQLLTAAQMKFESYQSRWRQLHAEGQPSPDVVKGVEQGIQRAVDLVNAVAKQLYFASGAFDDKQQNDSEGQLTPAQLRRFWQEAAPLLAALTSERHPNVAYDVVQTLEHLMPYAPSEVFLLAAKSICTSSQVRFNYDSLALGAVVKLIQRALADHREIFQDKDSGCLKALLEVLDLFVEAGWPQARQLTYRLEEIYR